MLPVLHHHNYYSKGSRVCPSKYRKSRIHHSSKSSNTDSKVTGIRTDRFSVTMDGTREKKRSRVVKNHSSLFKSHLTSIIKAQEDWRNNYQDDHLKSILDDYLKSTSATIQNSDVRIKFAKWLLKNKSLDKGDLHSFIGLCCIIDLMAKEIIKIPPLSSDKHKEEDCLVANLIEKASLILSNQDQDKRTQLSDDVTQTSVCYFDTFPQIKPHLPSAYKALERARMEVKGYFTTASYDYLLSVKCFRLMGQHFSEFQEDCFPLLTDLDLLTTHEMTLLKKFLDFSAGCNFSVGCSGYEMPSSSPYSPQNQLERIQAGFPTIILSGAPSHREAILLFWGNQLAICQCGRGVKRSVQVYHFDPSKLNEYYISEMISRHGNLYHKVELGHPFISFELFYKWLDFTQTVFDNHMEKAASSMFTRTIGSPSFFSAAGAIYAFLLMGALRGINEQGHLMDEDYSKQLTENKAELEKRIKRASDAYQVWSSHFQSTLVRDAYQQKKLK